MPWLLASPGHQQPWYWLCRISLTRGGISSTYVLLVWRNDIKCKYMFMFPLKNLARKGLTYWIDLKIIQVILHFQSYFGVGFNNTYCLSNTANTMTDDALPTLEASASAKPKYCISIIIRFKIHNSNSESKGPRIDIDKTLIWQKSVGSMSNRGRSEAKMISNLVTSFYINPFTYTPTRNLNSGLILNFVLFWLHNCYW